MEPSSGESMPTGHHPHEVSFDITVNERGRGLASAENHL